MNKIIILLALLASSFTSKTMCMKRKPTTTEQQTKKMKLEDQEGPCSLIPSDLLSTIFIAMNQNKAKKPLPWNILCTQTTVLSLVNRTWNTCINNPNVIRNVITTIFNNRDNSSVNRTVIARKISTSGTKNYLAQSCLIYHKVTDCYPRLGYSIQELVLQGGDVNFDHNEGPFLHITSKKSSIQAKQLLDFNANVDMVYQGETALSEAIKRNDSEMIELMLHYNPKNKCLQTAIDGNNPETIELLLHKANLTKDEIETASNYALNMNEKTNQAAHIIINRLFQKMKREGA